MDELQPLTSDARTATTQSATRTLPFGRRAAFAASALLIALGLAAAATTWPAAHAPAPPSVATAADAGPIVQLFGAPARCTEQVCQVDLWSPLANFMLRREGVHWLNTGDYKIYTLGENDGTCESKCAKDLTCTSYANVTLSDGLRCITWFNGACNVDWIHTHSGAKVLQDSGETCDRMLRWKASWEPLAQITGDEFEIHTGMADGTVLPSPVSGAQNLSKSWDLEVAAPQKVLDELQDILLASASASAGQGTSVSMKYAPKDGANQLWQWMFTANSDQTLRSNYFARTAELSQRPQCYPGFQVDDSYQECKEDGHIK